LGNSSALGKALLELRDLGLISRLPKLSIIQAAGANPLVRMIRSKASRLEPIPAETLATAIRIGNPASWKKALRVLQQTSGTVEEATEVEIAEAKAQIGADGIGCEPASAVTLVGARKLLRQGFIGRGEQVVLVLTGHLLKDPEFTLKFHRGELFADSPHAGQAKALALLQRAPILLEANAGAVVKVLEAAERQPTR
jgi:threonine synthase